MIDSMCPFVLLSSLATNPKDFDPLANTRVTLFEMMSTKPRRLLTIAPLENNPLCIAYSSTLYYILHSFVWFRSADSKVCAQADWKKSVH
jgi:hypothetical protein